MIPLLEFALEQAADAGIELEQLPIAREGFVFIVNKDNPVDMLTQQQLRDIYSGKITNWSEVGGPDMPIIAAQDLDCALGGDQGLGDRGHTHGVGTQKRAMRISAGVS